MWTGNVSGKNIVKKTDFDQNQIKVANRYMF